MPKVLCTASFLCAFSAPPIFWKSNWKSKSCWAPSTFCVLFHSSPQVFFEIKVTNPGLVAHPQLFVDVFTQPPLDFLEIQELLGTLNFLCAFSLHPPSIFWKSKWKSRSGWAPSAFYALFHPPPPPFFINRSGKSRRKWAP